MVGSRLSITNVTRWLYYFSVFGHFHQWKSAQWHTKFVKIGLKVCQIKNKLSKIAKDLIDFAKVAKLRQIWSHCCWPHRIQLSSFDVSLSLSFLLFSFSSLSQQSLRQSFCLFYLGINVPFTILPRPFTSSAYSMTLTTYYLHSVLSLSHCAKYLNTFCVPDFYVADSVTRWLFIFQYLTFDNSHQWNIAQKHKILPN